MASMMQFSSDHQRLESFRNWPRDARVTKHAFSRAGFIYTGEGCKVKCPDCETQIDDKVQSFQLYEQHKNNCNFAKQNSPQNRFSSTMLKNEEERLKTFEGWPLKFISPEKLAKAGLYYLKEEDHAQCVYCRGKLGHWEEGDEPMAEHKRYFPNCPFVLTFSEHF